MAPNDTPAAELDTSADAAVYAQLHSIRESIDNIDAAVVHMLAERFKFTQQVGTLKASHGLPPADPEREREQIAATAGARRREPPRPRLRREVPQLHRRRGHPPPRAHRGIRAARTDRGDRDAGSPDRSPTRPERSSSSPVRTAGSATSRASSSPRREPTWFSPAAVTERADAARLAPSAGVCRGRQRRTARPRRHRPRVDSGGR